MKLSDENNVKLWLCVILTFSTQFLMIFDEHIGRHNLIKLIYITIRNTFHKYFKFLFKYLKIYVKDEIIKNSNKFYEFQNIIITFWVIEIKISRSWFLSFNGIRFYKKMAKVDQSQLDSQLYNHNLAKPEVLS